MRAIALLAASLTLLLATQTVAAEDGVYLEEFRCASGRLGLRLPEDRRQLLALGRFQRDQVLEVEQHEGYQTTRKHLQFEGLSLRIIEFSNDPARYIITGAEVSNPLWNKLTPFKLGASLDTARSLLGGVATSDAQLRRSYGSEDGSIAFKASQGVLFAVQYNCYSG